jgi:hypothetical protein
MRKILFYFLSVYSVVKKADPDEGKGGNAHLYRALKQGGAPANRQSGNRPENNENK